MMQQGHTSSLPTKRTWWHEVSRPARVTFACSAAIVIANLGWSAIRDWLRVSHPLNISQLWLTLLSTLAYAACGVIFIVGTFRARRAIRRSRKGLCPACGYDIRAASDRCPECGSVLAERAA